MKRDKHLRPTPDQAHRDVPAIRFWEAIDRDRFELALSDNDRNDKYAAFLQALSDPTYARCSFPTLLRKFNISLHEAQTLYTDQPEEADSTFAATPCVACNTWGSRMKPKLGTSGRSGWLFGTCPLVCCWM